MIERLENYLKQSHLTLLLVTHDRYFLERVCTNILELDRGKIHSYNGNYQIFLEKKAQREELEQKTVHNMKQLRRHELDRMRRAPGARRTKQYARIKDFEELEDTYKASKSILNEKAKKLTIEVNQRRMGDKILKIHHLKKSFGDKPILRDFSHDFRHGERVGIIGKNGV
ncbi:ABC-F family ATP-binding cassette domain-containing protein [Patescibacteria group bacterium]|nr:ABC-F family ATP-binding cassette domain-containing protein [Patescibacteria group bacterium]